MPSLLSASDRRELRVPARVVRRTRRERPERKQCPALCRDLADLDNPPFGAHFWRQIGGYALFPALGRPALTCPLQPKRDRR